MEGSSKRKRDGENNLDGESFSKKVDRREDKGDIKPSGGALSFTVEDLEKESTFVNGGLFGLLLNVEKLKINDQFKRLLVAGNARLSCRNENLALLASGAIYPN